MRLIAADGVSVFALCRYCGDELERAREALELCSKCEGSPLCDRCGHRRADHTKVFVRGGARGCNRAVGDFQTLMSWTCGCERFRPIVGALSDASFAMPDPESPMLPPLRVRRG